MIEDNYKHEHGWDILFGKIMVIFSVIGFLFVVGVMYNISTEETLAQFSLEFNEETKEDSAQVAENFILNSPTYIYDGYDLTRETVSRGECPGCWNYVFGFKTKNNGFGDRAEVEVPSLVTFHQANIEIEYGEVVRANIDEVWDIFAQDFLTYSKREIMSMIRGKVYKKINLNLSENK